MISMEKFCDLHGDQLCLLRKKLWRLGVLIVDVAVTRSLSCNPELYSGPTGPVLFSASWTESELVSLLAHKLPYSENFDCFCVSCSFVPLGLLILCWTLVTLEVWGSAPS